MSNAYQTPGASVLNEVVDATYQPNVFSFHGRIGRLRYLGYCFAATLVGYLLLVPGGLLLAAGEGKPLLQGVGALLVGVAYIGMIALTWGYMVRRLNDLDRTGWLSLLMLVPLLNLILALYLIFARGNDGANRYGPAPVANPPGMFLVALILPAIFVIGILAAVSIPAYQDYVKRASEAQQSIGTP